MSQNLEEVLQQLHTALIGLNTFLENQKYQAETEIQQDDDASITFGPPRSLLLGLEYWVEGHILNKTRLLEIRNGFTRALQERRNSAWYPPTDFDADAIYLVDCRALFRSFTGDISYVETFWPEETPFTPGEKLYKPDASEYPTIYEGKDQMAPGRIIIRHLNPEGMAIGLPTLVVLYNWLQGPFRQIDDQFIDDFTKPKNLSNFLENNFRLTRHSDIPGRFWISYHLNCCRYWKPELPQWATTLHDGVIEALTKQKREELIPGIEIKRDHAVIRSTESRHPITNIFQTKQSLSLEMVQLSDTVACTLLAIDDMGRRLNYPNFDRKTWKEHGILPCGNAIGIAQFQAMICVALDGWEQQWMEVLATIDSTTHVQFDGTRNEHYWNSLMFDNSFERSKLYFTVLQLLRVIRGWIEETVADQNALRQHWLRKRRHIGFNFTDNELRNIERNWDTVLSKADLQAKKLTDRLDRKTEEVKSLRDGLFNATSLREAGKGMALNRAIYVFTVVTVIYTPLGFVATFWALPVVNGSGDANGLSLTALISTFVIIPLLTYMISLFAIGYFTIESTRRAWNLERFQRFIKKIMDLFGIKERVPV